MSFLSNILALLPDNISKRIKPVDLRNSFEYVYADMAKLQEDRILTLGAITATTTSIHLALHTSEINSVEINGNTRSKNTADHWTFPEVTEEKVFQVYAEDTPAIFGLAEDGEEIPAGALIVATLSISEDGIDIIEATSGFREKSVDNFAIYSLAAGDRIIGIGSQMRLKVQSAGAVRIGGFVNEEDKIYNGCPISVRNDTPFPMEFYNAVDVLPEFMPINPDDLPFSIKPGETANFAWRGNVAEIIKTGGGGAELPPGTNGQIYEIDNSLPEKIKPSDRLTNVESLFSALVDKWIHYYDATTAKMQPIVKLVTGVINQLEFTGRIKADAIVLPSNSNAVVPNRLRSDGSRLKYADDLAVEKDIAFISDMENDRLITRYVHSGNLEFYPTAIDYATGYVTCPSHGMSHSGQRLVGLFSTFITSGVLGWHPLYVIPYEWSTAVTYVKVIDANTLMICNSSGAVIPVNPTSSQNNGRLDITKWHIEDFVGFETNQSPVGVNRFTITIKGVGAAQCRAFANTRKGSLYTYNQSNIKTLSDLGFANAFAGNNNRNNIPYVQKMDIDLRESFMEMKFNWENSQFSGGGGVGSTTVGLNTFFLNLTQIGVSKGFYSFANIATYNNLCNGSVIEIFRQ